MLALVAHSGEDSVQVPATLSDDHRGFGDYRILAGCVTLSAEANVGVKGLAQSVHGVGELARLA